MEPRGLSVEVSGDMVPVCGWSCLFLSGVLADVDGRESLWIVMRQHKLYFGVRFFSGQFTGPSACRG